MKSTALFSWIVLMLLALAPRAWPEEPTFTDAYAAAIEQVQAGDFEAAEKHMSAALGIASKELPPDDPQIGILAFNLGRIRSQLGRYAEARGDFELAVSVYGTVHGEQAAELLPALDGLADCLDALGDSEESYEVRKRILAVTEKAHGKSSVEVAEALVPLAQYAGRSGKSRKANGYLRRAHKIWKKERGAESREAAMVLFFLGLNDLGLGELARGMERIEEASEIVERTVPDGDPEKIQLYATLLQIAEQMSAIPGAGGGFLDVDDLQAELNANRAAAERPSAPDAARDG